MGDTFNFMNIKFSCELISKNHIMSLMQNISVLLEERIYINTTSM